MLADFAFIIAEGVLILSPIICAADLLKVGRTPQRKRASIVVAALVFTTLGIVCAATDWSVRGVPTWTVCVIAYCGFVVIASAASRWPCKRSVRYPLLGLVLLVMSLAACLFPITFLQDYEEHGNKRMSAGYRFSAEWFGGAWSDHDGAFLSLYRTYWWLPFMERRIWWQRFVDDQCDFRQITERWSADRKALVVHCPGLEHDVILEAK